MTDVPAPPPQQPAPLRPKTAAQRIFNSPFLPVLTAVLALVLSVNVYVTTAKNTQDIARTSQQVSTEASARSSFTEELNGKLSAAFCDWMTTIANVPVAPTAELGKQWVLQSRTTVGVLECNAPQYTIPDTALCAGLVAINPRCPKPANSPA